MRKSIWGHYKCRYCDETRTSPGGIAAHYRQDHKAETKAAFRKLKDAKRAAAARAEKKLLQAAAKATAPAQAQPTVAIPAPENGAATAEVNPRQCQVEGCDWATRATHIRQAMATHIRRAHTERGRVQSRALAANFHPTPVNGVVSETIKGANFEFSFNGRDFKSLAFAIKGETNGH